MNLEDAKILVAARIASMTAALQIGHWNIRVVFEPASRWRHGAVQLGPALPALDHHD